MKRIAFYFLLVFHSLLGKSQITFEKSYGGQGSEFGFTSTQTQDGGYISVGCTNSFGAGSYDVYVVKTSATGGVMWTRTFGGPDQDYGTAVLKMNDCYLITGFTNSYGHGGFDIYVLKIDLSGNLIWSQSFGGSGDDFSYAIEKGSNNTCFITGKIAGSGNQFDGFILSLFADGNVNWFKAYGGQNDELFTSIKKTSDGGFCLSGITTSFGQGYQDAYILKVDSLGNKDWSRVFGSTNTDYASAGIQTSDGNYIITGGSYGYGAGLSDAFLVKLDAEGNILWQNTFGGQGMDSGNDVVECPGSGYFIVGHSTSFSTNENVLLINVSESGNAEYARSFGGAGNSKGYHVELAQGSGLIIKGDLNQKMYMIKTAVDGTTSCSVNANVQTYASEFIFDSPTEILTSSNIQVYYFPALTASGGVATVKCYSNGFTNGLGSEIVLNENVELASSAETFVQRDNIRTVDSSASGNLKPDFNFKVYPNPGNGSDLTISLSGKVLNHANVVLYDQLGKQQFSTIVSSTDDMPYQIVLDKKLPSGFYMIQVSSGDETRSGKWIVN